MAVTFPKRSGYLPNEQSVGFPVDVDGVPYRVIVSVELLQDRFGLRTTDAKDAVATFEANRYAFEAKATEVYGKGARGDVHLTNASF